MPRHSRLRNRGRPSPVARRRPPARHVDPAASLRALIQVGTVAAAALDARDDLRAAAISMQRLGSLTSGMWRALSRELMTAAERLDRQSDEYLDDVYRRAKALEVAPAAVLAAGVAAGHLAEHRETLESLLPAVEEEVRQLAAPEVLLGFSVDDEVLVEDTGSDEDEVDTGDDDGVHADDEATDDVPRLGIDVWLFLWQAPLSPARVRIVPELAEEESGAEPDVSSVSVGGAADDALLNALSATCGLAREDALPALSALGLACWSAHQADESADADQDDDDLDDDLDGAERVDTEDAKPG